MLSVAIPCKFEYFRCMIRVNLIGYGNIGTHLARALAEHSQVNLQRIWARTPAADSHLPFASTFADWPEADLDIICVSDAAIAEIAAQKPETSALTVHTAGSVSLNVFSQFKHSGVLYPLQTFSKNKAVDFAQVPFCLETQHKEDYPLLERLAQLLSPKTYAVDSLQRKQLHLSAVFVCNFVNHMYRIGEEICEKHQLPFEVLQPLIAETADKIKHIPPSEAQTGPAVRFDTPTLEAHLELLGDSTYSEIYQLLSQSIQTHGKKL